MNQQIIANWKFRGYDENDNEIVSFIIEDRTEGEATNEAMSYVENINTDVDDWSLTQLNQKPQIK